MKKVLDRIYDELTDIRFAASSLAFSTLLSIIPFLIIVLAVFQSVGGLEVLYPKIEGLLLNYMKEATGSTVTKYIKSSLQSVNSGTVGISGLLLLVITTLGLIRNIDVAFNKIWKIKITKPAYKRIILHWLILLTAPLPLAVLSAVKSISYLNDAGSNIENQLILYIWIASLLFLLYKVIPDIKVKTSAAIVSALAASFALAGVQSSFLWLSLKVFKNNKIYGSLASFPIFLVWLLVVWYVVLAGVAICAFLQHKLPKKVP